MVLVSNALKLVLAFFKIFIFFPLMYVFTFAEAVVRGFKQGLLTAADYNNLSQCETLDDIKLYMVRCDF